jgi:hypothetical protein
MSEFFATIMMKKPVKLKAETPALMQELISV